MRQRAKVNNWRGTVHSCNRPLFFGADVRSRGTVGDAVHETCGALHSNLRPVRLAMLTRLSAGRSGGEERKQPWSCQPHPFEPGAASWSGRFHNETYSYAAVDQQTGEVPLRLSDRHALVALCQRLGWAVEEKSKLARETHPFHSKRCQTKLGSLTKTGIGANHAFFARVISAL